MAGPLDGVYVLELAGIGPAPMACMLLADLGAQVLRIERPGAARGPVEIAPRFDLLQRGRAAVRVDLKSQGGAALVSQLAQRADVLVESFRPGVTERLGLGPADCAVRNPRLIYARMTGWGQHGPLAQRAGHDLNYIALTGALHAMGRQGQTPAPPLNLVGDFGGGALYMVVGVLAALLERMRSGTGQVIDAAVVDGTVHLMTLFQGLHAAGQWSDRRGTNLDDGGAPFYDVYETADGQHLAIAALEPAFFERLARGLGLPSEALGWQADRSNWPRLRGLIADAVHAKTRAEWTSLFEGSDACVSPVLSMAEAPGHPHLAARASFEQRDGVVQSAPAPRFSRTPATAPMQPRSAAESLSAWGIAAAEQSSLTAAGVLGQADPV